MKIFSWRNPGSGGILFTEMGKMAEGQLLGGSNSRDQEFRFGYIKLKISFKTASGNHAKTHTPILQVTPYHRDQLLPLGWRKLPSSQYRMRNVSMNRILKSDIETARKIAWRLKDGSDSKPRKLVNYVAYCWKGECVSKVAVGSGNMETTDEWSKKKYGMDRNQLGLNWTDNRGGRV